MKCKKCTDNDILFPSFRDSLQEDFPIYKGFHDSARIKYCDYCSSLFLEYQVQIYDDHWIHWIAINKEERNQFEHIRKKSDPQDEIVDFIMSKPKLICEYPSGKLKIRAPFIMHLDGPPW